MGDSALRRAWRELGNSRQLFIGNILFAVHFYNQADRNPGLANCVVAIRAVGWDHVVPDKLSSRLLVETFAGELRLFHGHMGFGHD